MTITVIQTDTLVALVDVIVPGQQGPIGNTGATGAKGATGRGVPAGGTIGQVPFKASSTTEDVVWGDLTVSAVSDLPAALSAKVSASAIGFAVQAYSALLTALAIGPQVINSDADLTLQAAVNGTEINHTGTLTADRLVTLSTLNAYTGLRFRVNRTGGGQFDLNIGGLIKLQPYQFAEVTYNGIQWTVTRYQSYVTAAEIGVVAGDITAASNNVARLNAALAKGAHIKLKKRSRYYINASVNSATNSTLEGPRRNAGAELYMLASGFTNTSKGGRYNSNGTGLNMNGLVSGALTPITNAAIRNLQVTSEANDGRYLCGVVSRNAVDCSIVDVEVSGLPAGSGITVESWQGGKLDHPYVHDMYSNVNYGTGDAGAQVTGIEIDDNRPNGPSLGVEILCARIESIQTGPVFNLAHGVQSDGINVKGAGATPTLDTKIIAPYIQDVHEGIDNFGSFTQIIDARISNVGGGIKIIHGAKHCTITNPNIDGWRYYGFGFFGAVTANGSTSNNVVMGGVIGTWVSDPEYNEHTNACILIDGVTSGTNVAPSNNSVIGTKLRPGSAPYGWVDSSDGDNNVGVNIDAKRGDFTATNGRASITASGTGKFITFVDGALNAITVDAPVDFRAYRYAPLVVITASTNSTRKITLAGAPYVNPGRTQRFLLKGGGSGSWQFTVDGTTILKTLDAAGQLAELAVDDSGAWFVVQ